MTAAVGALVFAAVLLALLAVWWLQRDAQRQRRHDVMQYLARTRNHRKGRT